MTLAQGLTFGRYKRNAAGPLDQIALPSCDAAVALRNGIDNLCLLPKGFDQTRVTQATMLKSCFALDN